MADIRINALATTAASTASDDFIAVDGSANGTRKLNAYSPTFGGNVVATGTLTVNSTTDSSSKDTGAIVTEGGLGVEKSATIGGNLTVSGTGNSSIAGNLLFNTSTARGILTINKTASDTLSTANAAAFIGQPDNLEAGLLMQQTATTPYSFVLQGRSPSGTYQFPISLNPQGGSVLVGTTIDGGQKLQVNGTMSIYGASTADTFTVTRASNTANGMLKFITTSTEDWIVGQRNTSDSDFHFYSYGISADALKLERSTGNATFAGSIQTAAPSGGSAIAWKLGVRVLATTTLDTTQYLQVDVGGTLYKVALVTS